MRGLKHGNGAESVGDNRRTPQGVRGLKPVINFFSVAGGSRTPQGVRGLKRAVLRRRHVHYRVALRKECVD